MRPIAPSARRAWQINRCPVSENDDLRHFRDEDHVPPSRLQPTVSQPTAHTRHPKLKTIYSDMLTTTRASMTMPELRPPVCCPSVSLNNPIPRPCAKHFRLLGCLLSLHCCCARTTAVLLLLLLYVVLFGLEPLPGAGLGHRDMERLARGCGVWWGALDPLWPTS